MGAQWVDKLWLEVAGRPVVAHTWKNSMTRPLWWTTIPVIRGEGMQPLHCPAEQFHFQKRFRLSRAARSDRIQSEMDWKRFRPARKLSPFRMPPGLARRRN